MGSSGPMKYSVLELPNRATPIGGKISTDEICAESTELNVVWSGRCELRWSEDMMLCERSDRMERKLGEKRRDGSWY